MQENGEMQLSDDRLPNSLKCLNGQTTSRSLQNSESSQCSENQQHSSNQQHGRNHQQHSGNQPRVNYQQRMEEIIAQESAAGRVPKLLLHSCCAPCSSYCLTVLSEYFEVTVLYYNPNIYPEEEYRMRAREQERLITELPVKHPVSFVEGQYDTDRFYAMAKGLEQEPEGGKRCFACYELRLREAAEMAVKGGFDYFTTTLSISPLKNAQKLNEIGGKLAEEYGVAYLFSDFKKKDGYKKSTEISREYGMYRQNYCGCVYSLRERNKSDCVNEENMINEKRLLMQ